MASRPLHHPELDTIKLVDLLHALADPIRLAIVNELRNAEGGMNCVATMNRVQVTLPKSTCSQHFQILREAGLIACERRGVELTSRLRIAELDSRFPGLISAILKAHAREQKKARRKSAPLA